MELFIGCQNDWKEEDVKFIEECLFYQVKILGTQNPTAFIMANNLLSSSLQQ
jgi:hypothetical protein